MDTPLEYVAVALSAYTPIDAAKHIYRKELIYADNFVIKHEKANYEDFMRGVPGSRLNLVVGNDAIKGWADTANLMLSRGVDILVPEGHTKKEDNSYGKAVKFETGTNEDGKPALYAHIQFKDDKAAKTALSSNVSIYAEPSFTDGLGNKYEWPITHIAKTDYPMIPKLGSYQAIAASLLPEEKPVPDPVVKPDPKTTETLDSLLTKYGITVPTGATEDQKKELLKTRLDEINSVLGIVPTVKPEEKPVPEKLAASAVTPVVLSMLSKGRKAEIEALVADNRITPAQQTMLVNRWCSDNAIRIACSSDTSDGFDAEMELLRANETIKSGSATGPQVVALSRDTAGKSSLKQDAERRREEAQKKNKVVV